LDKVNIKCLENNLTKISMVKEMFLGN